MSSIIKTAHAEAQGCLQHTGENYIPSCPFIFGADGVSKVCGHLYFQNASVRSKNSSRSSCPGPQRADFCFIIFPVCTVPLKLRADTSCRCSRPQDFAAYPSFRRSDRYLSQRSGDGRNIETTICTDGCPASLRTERDCRFAGQGELLWEANLYGSIFNVSRCRFDVHHKCYYFRSRFI